MLVWALLSGCTAGTSSPRSEPVPAPGKVVSSRKALPALAELELDLDGDGRDERAWADGRFLHLEGAKLSARFEWMLPDADVPLLRAVDVDRSTPGVDLVAELIEPSEDPAYPGHRVVSLLPRGPFAWKGDWRTGVDFPGDGTAVTHSADCGADTVRTWRLGQLPEIVHQEEKALPPCR